MLGLIFIEHILSHLLLYFLVICAKAYNLLLEWKCCCNSWIMLYFALISVCYSYLNISSYVGIELLIVRFICLLTKQRLEVGE